MMHKLSSIEKQCREKNIKLTEQRRIIASVISEATDHPDVEELHRRASKIDPKISIPTIYRTVRLLEESGIIEKHDFKDGRARYEENKKENHYHLINLKNGEVLEFESEEINKLKYEIAKKLGFNLVDCRLELYGVPQDKQEE